MDSSPTLPCGASQDDLLAQVADRVPVGDPAHQRRCPHCQGTLAELEAIWAPVHDLVNEDVRPPAGLLSSVMARVREMPRHTWHAVIHTDQGTTRIAARVVGAIARLAGEEVPHVTLALGGGRTAEEPTRAQLAGSDAEGATTIGVAGTRVVVDVHVVVEMGSDIPAVAAAVRRNIGVRIAGQTGLTADAVNVFVVDVQSVTGPAEH